MDTQSEDRAFPTDLAETEYLTPMYTKLAPGEHGMRAGSSNCLRPDCHHDASYEVNDGESVTCLCLCCCGKLKKALTAVYSPPSPSIAVRHDAMRLHDKRCFETGETNIAILD